MQNFKEYPQHKSPILHAIFTQLSGKRVSVLDLGEKIASNIQVFREHFYEVYHHNLLSSLLWQKSVNQKNGHVANTQLGQQSLDFGKIIFDIIICWDIFNFCSAPLRSEILLRLSKHCRPGSKVLMFSYSGSSAPQSPQKFYLTPKGSVHIAEGSKADRQKQLLNGSEIIKSSQFLTLKSTQILKPGMRPGIVELLFEYSPKSAENHTSTSIHGQRN